MGQVDRVKGLIGTLGVKAPCRVATTANITLSGTQTIDDVAVVAEDRVLVKNQTAGAENGIWVCQASVWVRPPDWDGAWDVVEGTQVVVSVGTAATGTMYRLSTTGTITIDTTSVVFAKASSPTDVTNAAASAAAAAADLVLTNADVVLTNADVVLTNADVVLTNADVVLTNADVVTTTSDAAAAAASAAAALVSENAAAASADAFDDIYLGSKTSDPTLDNDGNALTNGVMYWNSVSDTLWIYDGAAWQSGPAVSALTRSINNIAVNTNAGSSNYVDYVYNVTGTYTLTLPTAVGNTNLYSVKNTGTGVVSIASTSSQTFDGTASPITMQIPDEQLDLISDGTNWSIK